MLFTSWCYHFEICFSFLETVDKNMLNTKPLFICSLMNHFWSLTSKMFSFQPDDQLLFLHWMLLKLCATLHHLILEIVYYAAHVYRVFMLLVRPHLAGLPYSACVHICCTDERKKLRCWLKTLFRKYQSILSLFWVVVMLSMCKTSWVTTWVTTWGALYFLMLSL